MSKLMMRARHILLLTLLVSSIIPLVCANGIRITSLEDEDGYPIVDGDCGDTVVVKGDRGTAGVDVNVYWDSVKDSWSGGKGLLNSSEAESDGTFEIWFDVPEAVNGLHNIWVKDTISGATYGGKWALNSNFTVHAMLKLSPSIGLPGDLDIAIEGYGFSEEAEIVWITFDGEYLITSPRTPETDELGSWNATFTVPEVPYDDYIIYAEDEDCVFTENNFTVGACISLDPKEGAVGTVVRGEGRGFISGTEIVKITIDGNPCKILGDILIDDGEFQGEFVIPSYDLEVEEEYDVVVTDDDGGTADEEFEVTGLAEVEVDPCYGIQGATVSIHGYNFTAEDDVEVVLAIYYDEWEVEDYEADENGEFSGTFRVPAVSTGTYDLVARQEDYYIEADTEFRVGLIIVILSESSGPCGMEVALAGTGFTANKDWNATMGDVTIFEDEGVEDDGTISGDFYVPTLDEGDYTISVWDIDEEIEITVEFEVTNKTYIILDPFAAPVGYNVTITGKYFAEDEGAELEFVLYNSTDEWDITGDVRDWLLPWETAYLEEDGSFKAYWIVPDYLSLGDYTMNVTDEHDLYAPFEFTVVAEGLFIESLKDPYQTGDTVAFIIQSTSAEWGSYLRIFDPEDDLYWETDPFLTWMNVGTVYAVPYDSQTAGGTPMILSSNAPHGTWRYVFYDSNETELTSGTFNVEHAPMISEFSDIFTSNQVRVCYPSDSVDKPLGCAAAWVSDWLASSFVTTKLEEYVEGLDIDDAFVNQTTGKAMGERDTSILSFGGPIVNPVVKYAESDGTSEVDRAPIMWHGEAGTYYFKRWDGTSIPNASLPLSAINEDEDMFVIEVYKDGDGRYIMLCYGFGWQGTYAAGKYFDREIFTNLASYPYSWIILKWEDTNGDGFVNNPGYGDNYALIATSS